MPLPAANLSTGRVAACAMALLAGFAQGCSGSGAKSVAREPVTGEARVLPADPFATPAAPRRTAAQSATKAGESVGGNQYSIFGPLPNTGAPAAAGRSRIPDGAENLIQITTAPEGADFDPAVSPDGSLVYFASTRHRPTADLYVKSVDGTAVTQLTNDPAQDVMPAVSPDGKRLAFASNRSGAWNIYVMSAEGGQPIQVTRGNATDLHPAWSSDGKTIAFCRLPESGDRWEVWVADLTRPDAQKFLTFGLFPSWQPKGDTIAFQRSRDRGDRLFSVWTIRYTGGEAVQPTEVASSAVAAVVNPSWSPDGEHLAVAVVPLPETAGPDAPPAQSDVWIVRADGSERTNITAGRSVNLSPLWSPDGRIYFTSDRSGRQSIWSTQPGRAMVASMQPRAGSPAKSPQNTSEVASVPVEPAPAAPDR
ncbi:MAG: PD40 domain-containing protein [Phycisphaerales bacterium]|nr:PD40 domain-containing protein [Phycisphaerales bacterium]